MAHGCRRPDESYAGGWRHRARARRTRKTHDRAARRRGAARASVVWAVDKTSSRSGTVTSGTLRSTLPAWALEGGECPQRRGSGRNRHAPFALIGSATPGSRHGLPALDHRRRGRPSTWLRPGNHRGGRASKRSAIRLGHDHAHLVSDLHTPGRRSSGGARGGEGDSLYPSTTALAPARLANRQGLGILARLG